MILARRVASAVLLVWAGVVHADDAWLLIDVDDAAVLERAERMAIAEDLGARLAVIRSVVPLQSDADKAKVEARMQRLDDEALGSSGRGRFFLSVDYQHYQLLELLRQAAAALDCIYQAASEAKEMHCWAQLASIYLAEERMELGLATLRRRHLMPRDDDMPRVAQDPRVWYTEFGRGILRGIITPYLARASGNAGSAK